MYSVYMHSNEINGKVYVGITGRKPELRWRNGLGYKPKSKTQNAYFYNAILKYGWDSFKSEVLFSKLTKTEAELKEIELIKSLRSNVRKYGYNIENGGNSTGKLSEETKMKVAESWNLNREERSKRISEGKKGVKFSDEHRANLSKAKKGKPAQNRRPVSQYDLNMNFIKRWDSLQDAQDALGINKSNICRAIKYDRTAGGYKWTY